MKKNACYVIVHQEAAIGFQLSRIYKKCFHDAGVILLALIFAGFNNIKNIQSSKQFSATYGIGKKGSVMTYFNDS